MKKKSRIRWAGFLDLGLGALGWVATAAISDAQPLQQYRRGTLPEASFERLREWAHELDEVARHASNQAQAQQGGYRGFRRDTKFLRSIDHFADRAERFHERMDAYRTRPWQVDEEIEHLIRDAREVQTRLRRARFVDRHTVEDWEQVVDLLNRMLNEYRYPGRYDDRWGDRYRRYPDTGHGSYDDYRYSTDIRQLARELDVRAARMSQLADRWGGRWDGDSLEVRRFSDEARDFRAAVDRREFSRNELRSRVNRLLEEAQDAHSEISRAGADTRVADEWDGIVRVLDRMRNLVV